MVLLAPLLVLAQTKVLKGRVTGSITSEPLSGVSISVKGSTTGTTTRPDGTFEVTAADSASTLVISFVGYETQEVKLGKTRDYSIALKKSAQIYTQQIVEKGSPLLAIDKINMN